MITSDVYVEVAFGSTWQTEPADMNWTNVTARVLQSDGVSTMRGASSARGAVDVGRLDLSLLNSDREFDPTYADGDHFGELLPGVPIRLLAAVGGDRLVWDGESLTWGAEELLSGATIVPIWWGSVAKWPQRYDIGNRKGWVPVEAWDGFDKLSRAKVPRSVMESVVMPLGPVGYWPLADPGPDVTDVVGANYGEAFDEPRFGDAPIFEGLGSSVLFDGVNDRIDISRSWLWGRDHLPWTVVAALQTAVPAEVSSEHPIFMQVAGNNSADIDMVNVTTDGTVQRYRFRDGVGGVYYNSTPVDDNQPHVIFAGSDPVGSDWGVAIDSVTYEQTFILGATQSGNGVAIGGTPYAAKDYTDNQFDGSLAEVIVFDRPLTTSERQTILDGFDALSGQRTDERLAWILDELDWPTNLRDLETGNTTLGPATFKPGDGALEYLRLLTATEDGQMFIGPDGTLRFHDRFWRYLDPLATVSQFTFTDTDGDRGYAEFDLDLDDELLVNVARYTRRDGSEQVASDEASVAVHGEAEKQQGNLLNRTDNEVLSLAQWTVVTQSTPLPRIPKIRVPLHRYSEEDRVTVLSLDLGHRVTCERTPQGIGDPIELDFQIDGIRNDMADGAWWWEAFVSPVPEDTVQPFLLSDSLMSGADVLAY